MTSAEPVWLPDGNCDPESASRPATNSEEAAIAASAYGRAAAAALALSLLTACGSGDDTPSTAATGATGALNMDAATSPIDIDGLGATFTPDIPYGPGDLNKLDLFLPTCDEPTPLVIYVHGGGFTSGAKEKVYEPNEDSIRTYLAECIAFASVDYTLLDVPSTATPADLEVAAKQGGVRTPMLDVARALQFLRYHADELNLRADDVVLAGDSAGAGTSLWLGTHDDLADPDNPDPVLRESTRVTAVALGSTQATYDLMRWDQILAPLVAPFAAALGGSDTLTVAAALDAIPLVFTLLGVSDADQIESPATVAYRADVDMLALMDSGDAPIFVRNTDTGFDDIMNMFQHHYLHALAVKDQAEQVGLEVVAYSEDESGTYAYADPSGETRDEFVIRQLHAG